MQICAIVLLLRTFPRNQIRILLKIELGVNSKETMQRIMQKFFFCKRLLRNNIIYCAARNPYLGILENLPNHLTRLAENSQHSGERE